MRKLLYPFKRGGKFHNPREAGEESLLFETVPSLIRSFFWQFRASKEAVPQWHMPTIPPKRSRSLTVTWIGHATFLIQIGGINILTDPIMGHASPFFPRMLAPGLSMKQLPPIDAVLLSHNHHDHMDSCTLRLLKEANKDLKILVPLGDKSWFDQRNLSGAHEFMWWEDHQLRGPSGHDAIKCTFLPAIHWSRRGLFDRNASLWGSWMIQCGDISVYFAGDTAYADHFSLIAAQFPSIDVAILPVGPCEPRKAMQRTHLGTEEAGQAFLDLRARNFIPMHWGTFAFGIDEFDLPISLLRHWWSTHASQLHGCVLHLARAGEQIYYDPRLIAPHRPARESTLHLL